MQGIKEQTLHKRERKSENQGDELSLQKKMSCIYKKLALPNSVKLWSIGPCPLGIRRVRDIIANVAKL